MEGLQGTPEGSDYATYGSLWSMWPRPYEDVLERAEAVDLGEHLTPEQIEGMTERITALGLPDPDGYLRVQITRFSDLQEVHPRLEPGQLPEVIDQAIAAASDGSYA